MKFIVFNALLILALQLCAVTAAQAQYIWAKPAVVNIDSITDTFPYPVYMHTINYFRFISKNKIDSCNVYMTDDSANSLDKFVVYKTEIPYEITAIDQNQWPYKRIYEPTARITFYLQNGITRKMVVPLLFYPPVKVIFLDSLKRPLSIEEGIIKYGGVLFCTTQYNPPFYAVGGWSLFMEFKAGIHSIKSKLLKDCTGYFSESDEFSKIHPLKIDLHEFKKHRSVYLALDDTRQKEVDLHRYPLTDRFYQFKQENPAYYKSHGIRFVLRK